MINVYPSSTHLKARINLILIKIPELFFFFLNYKITLQRMIVPYKEKVLTWHCGTNLVTIFLLLSSSIYNKLISWKSKKVWSRGQNMLCFSIWELRSYHDMVGEISESPIRLSDVEFWTVEIVPLLPRTPRSPSTLANHKVVAQLSFI